MPLDEYAKHPHLYKLSSFEEKLAPPLQTAVNSPDVLRRTRTHGCFANESMEYPSQRTLRDTERQLIAGIVSFLPQYTHHM